MDLKDVTSGTKDATADINDALKEVTECQAMLIGSESQIKETLTSAIPKMELELPKLKEALFTGTLEGGAYEQVPSSSDKASLLQAEAVGETAGSAASDVAAQAQEAAEKAEREAAGMMASAKDFVSDQADALKQIVTSAVLSLTAAVAVALTPIGATFGPIIAALVAVSINFAGLAKTWQQRTDAIHSAVEKGIGGMREKLNDVLELVGKQVSKPLDKLFSEILKLVEEQKPAVKRMVEFESTVRKVEPDFDIPTPDDLKEPLGQCRTFIDNFVGKAKAAIPAELDSLVSGNFYGRLVLDKQEYTKRLVYLPLAIILFINVVAALLQVYLTSGIPGNNAEEASEVSAATRRLRGSSGNDQISFAGMKFTQGDLKKRIVPVVTPVFFQIALAAAQILLGVFAAHRPRVCKMANDQILHFEQTLSGMLNERTEEIAEKIFKKAFSEVKELSDTFFPKFKLRLEQTKKALEGLASAGKLADVAENAAASAMAAVAGAESALASAPKGLW